MTHSMTAFVSAQSQVDSTVIRWELKSVNHRYLESNFRIPDAFRFIEVNLRQALSGHISRGKLDCHLKINVADGVAPSFVINDGLMKAVLEAGSKLADNEQLANDLTVSKILLWPGIAEMHMPNSNEHAKAIQQLFQQAVEQLAGVRQEEGNKLKSFIKTRLTLLTEQVELARAEVSHFRQQARDKLLARLERLNLEVLEARIEQEIALMLTRLDVSEELDRLTVHIDEVCRILDSQGPVGRRLDFLMQELNREANTLSSKSDTSELTKHTVEMKVLIEQMREQIQNIE